MAPNGFHHLEGTYPEPGLFRLHLYDDRTRPLDAAGFSGTIRVEGDPARAPVALDHDAGSGTFHARLLPEPGLPLDLEILLTFPADAPGAAGREELFNFRFTRAGGEPQATATSDGASHHAGTSHAHRAPHGGHVITVGADHHFELVVNGRTLMLFILDAAEITLPLEGVKARLQVLPQGGEPVTLEPMRHGDHFMATAPVPAGERAVVVATVTMSDGTAKVGRFTLGAAAAN